MRVAELQINQKIYPLKPQRQTGTNPGKISGDGNKAKAFAEVLKENIQSGQKVRFSAHALKRIEERQLELGKPTMDRLTEGITQLNKKGSKNSVIFLDDTAFVVSVQNRTVVTAMDRVNNNQNIFTNIDSVAIV